MGEKEDQSYKGEAHGDRAIAGGLCWKGMLQMQSFGIDKKKPTVQTTLRSDTMAGRLEMRRERQVGGARGRHVRPPAVVGGTEVRGV